MAGPCAESLAASASALRVVHRTVQFAEGGPAETEPLSETQTREREQSAMNEDTGTPLQELNGGGGLTHHQITPLRRHGIATVERLAELVDAHRANPDGSELSTVASFGGKRIELVCSAIDRWRDPASGRH